MDLSAFVGKLLEEQDGDVLREGIRVLSPALMETEVADLIGADRHERSTTPIVPDASQPRSRSAASQEVRSSERRMGSPAECPEPR
jgi:transposase-like protein